MLLNAVFSGGSNKILYRKRIQRRLALCGFIAVCGLVLSLVSIITRSPHAETGFAAFMDGYIFGAGFGAFGATFGLGIHCIRMLRNEALLKAQEIKETDERNLFVAVRGAQVSFYASVALIFVSLIVLELVPGMDLVSFTLVMVLVAMLLIWIITSLICNKLF